jgi:very-short-patch-repair endonuclease
MKIEKEIPTGIVPIDIYMPKINLCIEVDGSPHYYGTSNHKL